MWKNRRVTAWQCCEQSAGTVWCCDVNLDQILKGMFPTSFRIHSKKIWGCFRAKGGPFSMRMNMLISILITETEKTGLTLSLQYTLTKTYTFSSIYAFISCSPVISKMLWSFSGMVLTLWWLLPSYCFHRPISGKFANVFSYMQIDPATWHLHLLCPIFNSLTWKSLLKNLTFYLWCYSM